MLQFGDFYAPLGQGAPLGEAFRQWFEAILNDGCSPSERSWFYGMCLVADGTLRPRMPQTGITQDDRRLANGDWRMAACRLLTNPARDRVSFELNVKQSTPCRVTMFDRTGRIAGMLAPGSYSAGSHRLSVDAHGLPAGVYFLSVTTGTVGTRIPVTVVH
jgi:hypothetical protein